jgi:aminoglycoside phosphotransferase (APT) family kinase protein
VPEWLAEVEIDAALVRRLLEQQFPELELSSLRLVGEGWDNAVWLVDERWLFRFPRRDVAVRSAALQIELLPRLASRLPLPIPEPLFAGRPDHGYPWPFLGMTFLPGRETADVAPNDAMRACAARPLGAFLRALHAPEVLEVEGVESLPVDPLRRADMPFRVERARTRLAEVRELGVWEAPPEAEELLAEAEKLPPSSRDAVVHGDLHLRHLLVDDAGRPTGIVDWDDCCRADPAIDLVLYWAYLPPSARPDFVAVYGEPDEASLLRGRVLALFICAAVAAYGRVERLAGVEREAVAGLDRAMK